MERQWQLCVTTEGPGRWQKHYVAMNPDGEINLSRFTHEHAGRPEAVNLMFDPLNNTVGVKPADPKTENVFRVIARGPNGGKLIRAKALLHQFGIKLTENVRFTDPVVDQNGILHLDLRKTTPAARRSRHSEFKL